MFTLATPIRIIPLAYDMGDIVYHRLSTERQRGMVTGISITANEARYWVTWPPEFVEKQHFEFELSSEFVPDYEV